MSRSSSRRSSGCGSHGHSDAIGHNHPILTEELVKTAAQVFDAALVFKLNFSGRGVASIRPTALQGCVNVTEINLSDNHIDRIQGFDKCLQLRRVILENNRVSKVEGLRELQSLETLLLQGNRIETIEDLNLPLLAELPNLKSLYLQNLDFTMANGVTKLPGYRKAVLSALPNLLNLDGERKPGATGYANAAHCAMEAVAHAEMAVTIDDLNLPPYEPWLKGFSWGETDNAKPQFDKVLKDINLQLKSVQGKVDQCRTLMKAVILEQQKCQKRST